MRFFYKVATFTIVLFSYALFLGISYAQAGCCITYAFGDPIGCTVVSSSSQCPSNWTAERRYVSGDVCGPNYTCTTTQTEELAMPNTTTNTTPSNTTNAANQNPDCTAEDREQEWLKPILGDGFLIPCNCIDSNQFSPCGVSEIITFIVNVGRLILAVSGSFALLMLVYGGLMFIVSGGPTGKGDKQRNMGKEIIRNALVGLVVVMCAWLIVNTTVAVLTGQSISDEAQIGDEQNNIAPQTVEEILK